MKYRHNHQIFFIIIVIIFLSIISIFIVYLRYSSRIYNSSRFSDGIHSYKIYNNDLVINNAFNSSHWLDWCQEVQSIYHVIHDKDWGSLVSNEDRSLWKKYDCNSLLHYGKVISCDTYNGKEFISYWRNNSNEICIKQLPLSIGQMVVNYNDKHLCRQSIFNKHIVCSFTDLQINYGKQIHSYSLYMYILYICI